MVNLEWFRTFKTIYETGTLTGTAEKLCISQPGVSLHLNSLEAYAGMVLFDRGTRKMVPTEQGKILYNSIVDQIDKLESVEKYLHRKRSDEKRTLNVGMCVETFQYVLEPHISSFGFNMFTKFGNYSELLTDLDRGLLDFVITPGKEDFPNISYTPFSKERMILVAGSKSTISDFTKMSEKSDLKGMEQWLYQQKWYGTTSDMEHLRSFWMNNFKKRPEIRFNYIVPNLMSIIRCISDNEGFAVLPDFLCKDPLGEGKIQVVWEGVAPVVNIFYFAQRKKTIYEEEIGILMDVFKKILN